MHKWDDYWHIVGIQDQSVKTAKGLILNTNPCKDNMNLINGARAEKRGSLFILKQHKYEEVINRNITELNLPMISKELL